MLQCKLFFVHCIQMWDEHIFVKLCTPYPPQSVVVLLFCSWSLKMINCVVIVFCESVIWSSEQLHSISAVTASSKIQCFALNILFALFAFWCHSLYRFVFWVVNSFSVYILSLEFSKESEFLMASHHRICVFVWFKWPSNYCLFWFTFCVILVLFLFLFFFVNHWNDGKDNGSYNLLHGHCRYSPFFWW